MNKFLSWVSYTNAVGLGIIAAMITVLVVVSIPLEDAPDWLPQVVGFSITVAYGLYVRVEPW